MRAQVRREDTGTFTTSSRQAGKTRPTPASHALHDLQRRAGNRAVRDLVAGAAGPRLQRIPEGETGIPDRPASERPQGGPDPGRPGQRPDLEPGIAGPAVELLQQKLNYHMGFMGLPLTEIDGRFGGLTGSAILAFKQGIGATSRSRRADAATWAALDGEPVARRGDAADGPAPETGRMFEDGLLEITVAVGFDEYGLTPTEARQLLDGLTSVRGWRVDPDGAARLRANAGRPAATGSGTWLTREGVGTSEGRPVHGVLRLVVPESEESGARTRAAALQGMDQSDAFVYTGHGRHGTGMDFDRNFRCVVNWDRMERPPRGRSGSESFGRYHAMLDALGIPNEADPAYVERLRVLQRSGVVEITPVNEGNVGINPGTVEGHAETPGSAIQNQASRAVANALAGEIRERRYRLWFFDGCTTRDYEQGIRLDALENANLSEESLDMTTLGSKGSAFRLAEAALSYLDGLLAGESAQALQHRAEEAHSGTREVERARAHSSGFGA